MKLPVQSEIGFADGEVVSYSREASTCEVIVKAWNDSLLIISFSDPIGICDYGVGMISAFCTESEPSNFMNRTIERAYDLIPSPLPHKLYQFLDLDDEPALEIVAENASISVK